MYTQPLLMTLWRCSMAKGSLAWDQSSCDKCDGSYRPPRKAPAWCYIGAYAAHSGRIGTIMMAPDSDNEVKLRWPEGGESSYINVDRLTRASAPTAPAAPRPSIYSAPSRAPAAAPARDAPSWCKKGLSATYNDPLKGPRTGVLTMDPDRDNDVKLLWSDGETSNFVPVSRLVPASAPTSAPAPQPSIYSASSRAHLPTASASTGARWGSAGRGSRVF
jgi:hypothetical protein